jgi:hypothetical protein
MRQQGSHAFRLHPCFLVVKLRGPARGRLQRRSASQGLEPNPRAFNGQAKRSYSEVTQAAVGLNIIQGPEPGGGGCKSTHSCCSCQVESIPPAPITLAAPEIELDEPPLQLRGARTEPSALLKVQGVVHAIGGNDVPVQPMIDSGASKTGFADPEFVRRCGVPLRPSSRRIVLANGEEVRATGEVTLTYSLETRTCRSKGRSLVHLEPNVDSHYIPAVRDESPTRVDASEGHSGRRHGWTMRQGERWMLARGRSWSRRKGSWIKPI